uniref:Chitin-binding type-2 domain-containing protein n=1 Tax=Anopheles funestus TaxID=62324 RepID=A0A182RAM4_ANOFN
MKFVFSIILFAAFCLMSTSGETAESCIEENELTANPSSCSQYYRCLSGKRILFSCTENKLFNPTTKRCVASDTYSCDEQQPELLSTSAPSSYCLTNKNGLVAHASDCDKFVVCEDGIEKIHTCPQGEQFSWKKLACGVDFPCGEYVERQGTSLEAVACAKQTLLLAEHPYDVDKYVDCKDKELRSCDTGTIFRWNYQRCLPGVVSTNELKSASPNCGAFGQSSHPYLCEKYFKCFFWISSLKSCPLGMIYNATQEVCTSGDFQTCSFAQN